MAYDRWVVSGETDNIKHRLSYYNGVYDKLLDNFNEASLKATSMLKTLEEKEEGNCKMMATRISQFKLADIIPKLKIVLKNYTEFW